MSRRQGTTTRRKSAAPARLLRVLGPGLLVAATGVGAGDLATAALTGSVLGVAVLWAVLVGAAFKFVLNEGLARWQLATGETLVEGAARRLGRAGGLVFLAYFLIWSFLVAAALMSACGITAQAMLPLFPDAVTGKIAFGIVHSLLGVVLVRLGGYRLFERVMSSCIAVMFLTVVTTAALLRPAWDEILRGLLIPTLTRPEAGGLGWTIALMGGVGGTVTVLCYGYWIREEGRSGIADLPTCRIDLAVGYALTALFGMAMVVMGSTVRVEGGGATLVVNLAERLGELLGAGGRWAFLLGAWGAVFSSLLGVWQSVPYLFVDIWRHAVPQASIEPGTAVDVRSAAYRGYLYALATVPMIGLGVGFASMQRTYAIVGAAFMPILAVALLMMNGRARWVGERCRNRPLTTFVLLLILAFFLVSGWRAVA